MKNLYQIIITNNNKQIEYIGSYKTKLQADKMFYSMIKQSDKTEFPIQFVNKGKSIQEAKYELIIIKKKEEGDPNTTNLRNEYGAFVEHETNNDDWIVYDKAPYYKEETFWVYGFHPLVQRKTFNFIMDNIIKPKATNKYSFLNVMVFKNKLILETTDTTDMIICKNISDCIRLYNTINKKCTDKKYKYILFNGDWNTNRQKRAEMIEKIHNLTNWNDLKINRSSTRP